MDTQQQIQQVAHSPLPWKIDEAEDLPLAIIEDTEDGYGVCELEFPETEQAKANAAFIVRACNSKPAADSMADALEEYLDYSSPENYSNAKAALAAWEKAQR